MAQFDDRVRGPRPRTRSRYWLGGLVAAAVVTGYWGFWLYRPPGEVTATALADLLYYDLQLFALEFNPVDGQQVPWLLQVGRVLAPAATVATAFFAIVGASWWWRRTMRWRYSIVVGGTAEARAVARAKRGHGLGRRAVFEIENGDVASLRAAGVRRARTVYACGNDREDVAANVAIALAAVSVRPRRVPRIFVHVTDPELALGLRARRLMTAVGQTVEFFTMDELAARAFVERETFGATARPEILIAGAGSFGRGVVVAFARHWRAVSGRAAERISVILVDADATAVRAALLDRWSVVAESCDITAIDDKNLDAVLRSGLAGRPYRSYICYDDEHVALREALAAVPLWHGGPGSLVVRLSQLSRHAEAFEDGKLLDHLGGALVVANVAALAAPEVTKDLDIFWDLAQALHARYLASQLAKGEQLRSRPALRPWADLAQVYRDSNYDQARDFANKLRVIGATVAPRSTVNPRFELTAAEVEQLAPLEHARWVRERKAAGWRFGEQVDDGRKRSPDLVPWDRLREQSRDKDRDAVRDLQTTFAAALADFGLQIVRLDAGQPDAAARPAQRVAGVH